MKVKVYYTAPQFTLTTSLTGTGAGTVSSSPAGINCGADCSENYTSGTPVTLTATAASGSTFAGWSGACSGTGTCAVTMSSAKSVTATFTLNTYTLSVSKTGTGSGLVSSSPAGVNCGADCSEAYSHGTSVTLTAAAASGSTFTGWSGACSGTGSCVVSMTSAKSVTANFNLNTYTLSVNKAGTGSGTVTSAPAGINCGADCNEAYANGTSVTLTAVAASGSSFTGWSGAGCSGTGTCVTTITAAASVTATFSLQAGTLTVNKVVVGGTKTVSDFTLKVCPTTGPIATTLNSFGLIGIANAIQVDPCVTVTSGTPNTLTPGWYQVTEINPEGWHYTMNRTAGNCDSDGKVYVGNGDAKTCEMTNTYVPPPTCPEGYTGTYPNCVAPIVCNPDANLLQNGGFEAPALDFGSWTIVTDSGISKWLSALISNPDAGAPGVEIQNHVAGSPFEGSQHAELDGNHPTAIWQNVVTNPGYDYALTFKYSPRPGTALGNNVLEVRKDGVALGSQISRGSTAGDTEWSIESRSFVGTGATAKIEFADVSPTDDSLGTYLDDMKLSCVGPHVPKATVVATKIVCDSESMLPDWSGQHHVIDATTATDYVASHEGCHIAPDWQFQWAPTSMGNPGDNTGAAEGWNTFTGSALITLGEMSSVWVREVWNDAYVHFTGTTDTDTISAEMYCNGDAYHYDNLDYARGLTDGGTVYCVAFNTPKVIPTEDTPQLCSDGKDNDGDQLTDGQDPDCTPSITVIKHVVNDNGLTKHASDFTLHVNVDQCTNLDGMQASVPQEYFRTEGGMCYPIDEEEFIHDAMNTVLNWLSPKTAYAEIVQLFAPQTFSGDEEGTTIYFNGATDYSVTEDADGQYSTTYGENCSGHIALGQHLTCVVTNDDIQQGGGGGSSFSPYPGCTNPAATNYNSLANVDDGSCIVPGGNGGGTPTTTGEVLGASTVVPEAPALPPACAADPYLRDYMKMGMKNDPEQVKRLQTFLNEFMGSNLPVSGIFGSLTKKAVKKLQNDHHQEIIQPWEDAGYSDKSLKEGTGVVYKTTKYFINKTKCNAINETLPSLENDPGLTN